MRHVTIALFTLLLAFVAQAQDLPTNVVGAGGGLQPEVAATGNYQASGWTLYCHRLPDIPFFGDAKVPNYACQATDFFGTATAARIDSEGVLVGPGNALIHSSIFAGGWKTGAGAATNQNGTGISLTLGGWGGFRISKTANLHLVFSGSWQKDDVMAFVQAPSGSLLPQLKTLGARGVYRIGITKSWN